MRLVYSVGIPHQQGDVLVLKLPEGARFLQLIERKLIVLADPSKPEVDCKLKVLFDNEVFDESELKCDYIGSFEVGNSMAHLVKVVN